MESYTVYKHTSPSGKVYIGITKLGVERRWQRGGNTPKMSEETRAKISKALTGRKCPNRRKHTEEEKRAISEKLKGRESPMKGRHWSVEQRAAVGTSIVCVNTGEEFYSIREASRVTGCDRSAIAMVLKGKYSQTRGLKFEYKR